MRQLSSVPFVGVLALLISSCGGEEAPPVASSPVPVPAPAAPAPAKPATFPGPVVTQSPGRVKAEVGLIQSTNANERARSVQSGRRDPFATFPVVPVIVRPSPSAAKRSVPTVRPIPSTGVNNANTSNRSPNAGLPSLPPTTPGSPGVLPIAPTLPPLPQPNLAQAVQVTGVVQVGEETQIIVKAPEEETSRYVRVGQRLSNGQVLIKRVEANQGSEPIVVLEQNGIEVPKIVGEPVPQPAQTTPPAA